MKGKTTFTQAEIEKLLELIRQRVQATRDKKKGIRNKMRQIGFYGSDFGIIDMQEADLDNLIKTGRIEVLGKKQNDLSSILKRLNQIGKTKSIDKASMTLHEAIESVLRKNKRPMSITEIADEINKRGLYTQRDGSPTNSDQIAMRAKGHLDLFDVTISLKRK